MGDMSEHERRALSALPKTNDGFVIYPGLKLYFLDLGGFVQWMQVREVMYSSFGSQDTPHWVNRWNKEPKDWWPVYALKKNALQARADALMKEVNEVQEQIEQEK